MSFIDVISAIVIISFFISGFSGAFLPAYNAWGRAMAEYRSAKTMQFIAESFRNECAKPDRNIENWIKALGPAKELESCEITEIRQGDVLVALKACCLISGGSLEIIGACVP